jgi:hypothetical protein
MERRAFLRLQHHPKKISEDFYYRYISRELGKDSDEEMRNADLSKIEFCDLTKDEEICLEDQDSSFLVKKPA